MTNANSLVSGIELKLRRLIDRQKELLQDLDKYQKEVQELKENQTVRMEEIEKLKEQYRILKLSKTLETKEGAVEAKAKISELVREIDKCIGLLNT